MRPPPGVTRALGWLSALSFGLVFAGGMAQSFRSSGTAPGIHTGYNGALDILLEGDEAGPETIDQLALALDIVVNEQHIQNHNLGVALQGAGRLDEAIAHYRAAVERRAEYIPALTNLGQALIETGQVAEGTSHLEAAHRLVPEDADVLVKLGVAHGEAKALDQAEARYREAIALDGEHAAAHFNLARVLHVRGALAEAMTLYRRAITFDRVYEARARRYLGELHVTQRRWPEALTELSRATELAPDDLALKLIAAKAALSGGQVARAIGWLEPVVAATPDAPEPLTLLAQFLATHPDPAKRQPARALTLAQRAHTLTRGEHPGVLGALASAYAANNQLGRAAAEAQKAVDKARAQGAEGLAGYLEKKRAAYAKAAADAAPAQPEAPPAPPNEQPPAPR